jgi:hypothetical protein
MSAIDERDVPARCLVMNPRKVRTTYAFAVGQNAVKARWHLVQEDFSVGPVHPQSLLARFDATLAIDGVDAIGYDVGVPKRIIGQLGCGPLAETRDLV